VDPSQVYDDGDDDDDDDDDDVQTHTSIQ